MKRLVRFIESTIRGSIWFLIPLVVLLVILDKAHQITSKVVAPIAHLVPVDSILGLHEPRALAVVAIVLFCFLAGLLAKTRTAHKSIDWLEATLLSNLPGYEFMRRFGDNLVGLEDDGSHQVVLARIEEAWQIGFLMETLENGYHAVFVPDAPRPWSGSVYLMIKTALSVWMFLFRQPLNASVGLDMGPKNCFPADCHDGVWFTIPQ
jgi:uncharacterized membrane protein